MKAPKLCLQSTYINLHACAWEYDCLCAVPHYGCFRQRNVKITDLSILQAVWYTGPLWYISIPLDEYKVSQDHSCTEGTTFSEKIWAPSSQALHFGRQSWLRFQEWGITKTETSEIEGFGSRSYCVIWICNWIQMLKLSHLPIVIFVSPHAVQRVYHMLSWGSFLPPLMNCWGQQFYFSSLLWWTLFLHRPPHLGNAAVQRNNPILLDY